MKKMYLALLLMLMIPFTGFAETWDVTLKGGFGHCLWTKQKDNNTEQSLEIGRYSWHCAVPEGIVTGIMTVHTTAEKFVTGITSNESNEDQCVYTGQRTGDRVSGKYYCKRGAGPHNWEASITR